MLSDVIGMICYIYIPGTPMTLVLIGKGLVLGGLTFKNRGHLGSRYIYLEPKKWPPYFGRFFPHKIEGEILPKQRSTVGVLGILYIYPGSQPPF